MIKTVELSLSPRGNYYRPIPEFDYDQTMFADLIDYALTTNDWQPGFDKRGFYFNLEFIRLDSSEWWPLQEFNRCLKAWYPAGLDDKWILSKVLPGGLAPHIDFGKTGNFALPLYGDFTSTPMWYYDNQSNITEIFYYTTGHFQKPAPVVFNTSIMHAVPMDRNDTSQRIVLMKNLYEWMPDVFKRVDERDAFYHRSTHFEYHTGENYD